MSAEIIPFPGGNGAREVVTMYLERAKSEDCDTFLAWLWLEGFKVVPLEQGDLDG